MSEQLSEKGKDLVKYMPQAVNALADKLIAKFEERLLLGEKPQTNADRIRAMTDEELADFMIGVAQRGGKPTNSGLIRWLDWLKQEATP